MSAEIVALRRKDGTAEFDCVHCGWHVVSFNFQGSEPLCAFCTVLGENSIAVQAWINRLEAAADAGFPCDVERP